MKRILMSCYSSPIQPKSNGVVDPEFVPDDGQMMDIFKEIFSVDVRTGLPKGDLAYYLSPDGNPQIKMWLENNLLKPRAVAAGSTIEGVTDDMLVEYSRRADETAFDYATRLSSIRDAAIADIEKFKNDNHE